MTDPTRRYRWLTPAAPAGIAILRMGAVPAAFDRPLPEPGTLRFARLVRPDRTVVDEVVVDRLDHHTLEVMTHGGPGIRAAIDAGLLAHGLVPRDDLPRSAGAPPAPGSAGVPPASSPDEPTPYPADWLHLATAAHPAAVLWLLAHPHSTPPFPADFLTRHPRVLITGPVNAGKSTLLNAWCGRDRALVSDTPGTTRDLVTATVLVHGWRLRLIDSAGLRLTTDPLESAGQLLVAEARRTADLVLYLRPPDDHTPRTDGAVEILGKSDLRDASSVPPTALVWSAIGEPDQSVEVVLDRLGCQLLSRLGLPISP